MKNRIYGLYPTTRGKHIADSFPAFTLIEWMSTDICTKA